MRARHYQIVIVPELPRLASVVSRDSVVIPDYGSPEANERAAEAAFRADISRVIRAEQEAACIPPITDDTFSLAG